MRCVLSLLIPVALGAALGAAASAQEAERPPVVVTDAGGRFDATSVLAVIVVIVAVALMVIGLVQTVEKRLTSWLPKSERGAA